MIQCKSSSHNGSKRVIYKRLKEVAQLLMRKSELHSTDLHLDGYAKRSEITASNRNDDPVEYVI